MTDADKANAITSRNNAKVALQQGNLGPLNATFPGIASDCSCNPFYTGSQPQDFSLPGVPLAGCNVAPKTGQDTTIATVGIDNGKVCPTGPQFIIPAAPAASPNLAASTPTTAALSCTASNSANPTLYACAFTVDVSGSFAALGFQIGQHFSFSTLDGVSTSSCDPAQNGAVVLALGATDVVIDSVDANTRKISFTSTFTCTSGSTIVQSLAFSFANSATVTATGAWSPLCDTSFTFYQANSRANGNQPAIGFICPSCTSSTGQQSVLFTYTGPNMGKFCSAIHLLGGVAGPAQSVRDTLNLGSSCLQIGVNSDTSAATGGTASLLQPLPNGVALSDVAPGLTGSLTEYNPTTTASVAIDTQALLPCSTPQLSRVPNPSLTTVGVVNQGTCNTASLFTNGGTGTGPNGNGIAPDSAACLYLTTSVNGPLAPTSPPPAGPTPLPAPITPPTPAAPSPDVQPPSPGAAPEPLPAPLQCAYAGTYVIRPLHAPCSGLVVAWASPSNCSSTAVTLNKASALGGKPLRAGWRLGSTAVGPLANPSDIVALKTHCTARSLAGVIDTKGHLRLASSSYKWQVIPTGKTDCSVVNLIAQNRLATAAFLNVATTSGGACSNEFSWVSKNGGRAQFKLIKAQ